MKKYVCDKCKVESTEDFLKAISVRQKMNISKKSTVTESAVSKDWFTSLDFDLCPSCKYKLDEDIRKITLEFFNLKDEK